MKIVLDTNVLLISLGSASPFRPIFDGILKGKFDLYITESILQEYTEIIGHKTKPHIAENVGKLLLKLNNVHQIQVYYHWNLIHDDPDDNKFVDCAIACGAKFLVTNDQHFKVLSNIKFPLVDVISSKDFLKLMQ